MKRLRSVIPIAATLAIAAGCVSTPAQRAPALDSDHATRSALPDLDKDAGLEQYTRYAALNNPGLKAAYHSWQAAVERIAQAESLPNPKLTYSYYIDSVETRVGPQEHKLALSQMLPWFGKRSLRKDRAALNAKAAYEEFQARKQELFYGVAQAYYEYTYLSDAIRISSENVKLMTKLESVARTKYKTGATQHSAVIKAQVELGKLEDELRRCQDLRYPLSGRLSAVLGYKPGTLHAWPQKEGRELKPLEYESAAIRAVKSNPSIKAATLKAERESLSVDLARKDRFPDLVVGAGYILTGDATDPTMTDSGKDAATVSVGLNLPVWFSSLSAAEDEALSRNEATRHELKDLKNGIRSDVEIAVYHYNDALRKMTLYKDTLIPKARQSFEVSRQAFEAGKEDFISLIDAQRLLLEFELALERSRANALQRRAEVDMLTAESDLIETTDKNSPTEEE